MPKPFKQGHLDGLCGVYSVINAINSILPKRIRGEERQALMKALFKTNIMKLDRRTNLAKTILEGLSDAMIKEMLNDCKGYLNNFGLVLEHEQLALGASKINYILNRIRKDSEYSNTAIIIGISTSYYSHWSVVKKIENGNIFFHDSAFLDSIPLENIQAHTSTHYKKCRIHPRDVFGIWLNVEDEEQLSTQLAELHTQPEYS